MAPLPVLEPRILELLKGSGGLTVSELVVDYNLKYGTVYDRRAFAGILKRLLKRLLEKGKILRLKDEHAEPGQRCLKYFVKE